VLSSGFDMPHDSFGWAVEATQHIGGITIQRASFEFRQRG
jgi:hypothetical protein